MCVYLCAWPSAHLAGPLHAEMSSCVGFCLTDTEQQAGDSSFVVFMFSFSISLINMFKPKVKLTTG